MQISGLGTPGISPLAPAPAPAKAGLDSFGDLLSEAVTKVNDIQWKADTAMMQLAAGEPIDLHQAMIAMEEATIAFDLALQVRNRLLEAYQEVMRMQI